MAKRLPTLANVQSDLIAHGVKPDQMPDQLRQTFTLLRKAGKFKGLSMADRKAWLPYALPAPKKSSELAEGLRQAGYETLGGLSGATLGEGAVAGLNVLFPPSVAADPVLIPAAEGAGMLGGTLLGREAYGVAEGPNRWDLAGAALPLGIKGAGALLKGVKAASPVVEDLWRGLTKPIAASTKEGREALKASVQAKREALAAPQVQAKPLVQGRGAAARSDIFAPHSPTKTGVGGKAPQPLPNPRPPVNAMGFPAERLPVPPPKAPIPPQMIQTPVQEAAPSGLPPGQRTVTEALDALQARGGQEGPILRKIKPVHDVPAAATPRGRSPSAETVEAALNALRARGHTSEQAWRKIGRVGEAPRPTAPRGLQGSPIKAAVLSQIKTLGRARAPVHPGMPVSPTRAIRRDVFDALRNNGYSEADIMKLHHNGSLPAESYIPVGTLIKGPGSLWPNRSAPFPEPETAAGSSVEPNYEALF